MTTDMKTTLIGLLAAAAAALQNIVQQGHDVTDWKTWALPVTPDGSRQWSVSGEEAARALVILAEK